MQEVTIVDPGTLFIPLSKFSVGKTNYTTEIDPKISAIDYKSNELADLTSQLDMLHKLMYATGFKNINHMADASDDTSDDTEPNTDTKLAELSQKVTELTTRFQAELTASPRYQTVTKLTTINSITGFIIIGGAHPSGIYRLCLDIMRLTAVNNKNNEPQPHIINRTTITELIRLAQTKPSSAKENNHLQLAKQGSYSAPWLTITDVKLPENTSDTGLTNQLNQTGQNVTGINTKVLVVNHFARHMEDQVTLLTHNNIVDRGVHYQFMPKIMRDTLENINTDIDNNTNIADTDSEIIDVNYVDTDDEAVLSELEAQFHNTAETKTETELETEVFDTQVGDELLATSLRAIASQIESVQFSPEELADEKIIADHKAVVSTLAYAAIMLENQAQHVQIDVTDLIVNNLAMLAARAEAEAKLHSAAGQTDSAMHQSLIQATTLAISRIKSFTNKVEF